MWGISPKFGVRLKEGSGFSNWGMVKVKFWEDDWLEVDPLFLLFPRGFMVVSNNKSELRIVRWVGEERRREERGGGVSWDVSCMRVLHLSEKSMS